MATGDCQNASDPKWQEREIADGGNPASSQIQIEGKVQTPENVLLFNGKSERFVLSEPYDIKYSQNVDKSEFVWISMYSNV